MNTIPLDSPNAFECVAADILDEFMDSFTAENGCAERVREDGSFSFSNKGIRLYERYQARLRAIGERLFPGEGADMSIKGWRLREDEWDD